MSRWRGPDGHEVLDLADARRGQEARDQDVRVREVELLDGADPERRRDAVAAAPARSRIAPKTLGESNRGQQYQSIVPSVPTSATVRRSPMTPCSAIGRYSASAENERSIAPLKERLLRAPRFASERR